MFRVSSASVGSRTQLHKVGEGRGVAHPAEAVRGVEVGLEILEELEAGLVVGEELRGVAGARHVAQPGHELLGNLGPEAAEDERGM